MLASIEAHPHIIVCAAAAAAAWLKARRAAAAIAAAAAAAAAGMCEHCSIQQCTNCCNFRRLLEVLLKLDSAQQQQQHRACWGSVQTQKSDPPHAAAAAGLLSHIVGGARRNWATPLSLPLPCLLHVQRSFTTTKNASYRLYNISQGPHLLQRLLPVSTHWVQRCSHQQHQRHIFPTPLPPQLLSNLHCLLLHLRSS
jgi:hypothetical protein